MTPRDDWQALDKLTQDETRMFLKMALTTLRRIKETPSGQNASFSKEGHRQIFGHATLYLDEWEDKWDINNPNHYLHGMAEP